MTTTEYDDDILTLDDVERIATEVLENSGPVSREDLERAVDEFASWALTAGKVWAWLAHQATLGWRPDTQELVLIPNASATPNASAPSEGRLRPLWAPGEPARALRTVQKPTRKEDDHDEPTRTSTSR